MRTGDIFASVGLYIILLVFVYCIHVNFFLVDVVFYAAIFDALLAVIMTVAALIMSGYFSRWQKAERILLVGLLSLLGYSTAISIPTVIDRSLSFYILEKLQQRGGAIKQAGFQEIIKDEYIREHRLVDVRLTEQLESGTIRIFDGCVTLTEKGAIIASSSRFFRRHFLPKRRLLLGEYSDDLVDPFRLSKENFTYSCKMADKS